MTSFTDTDTYPFLGIRPQKYADVQFLQINDRTYRYRY